MGIDPNLWQHKEWLGLLQPVGLVVSPVALVKHQAFIDRGKAIALQSKLKEVVSYSDNGIPLITDFPLFTQKVLEWLPEDLISPPQGTVGQVHDKMGLVGTLDSSGTSESNYYKENHLNQINMYGLATGLDLEGKEKSQKHSNSKSLVDSPVGQVSPVDKMGLVDSVKSQESYTYQDLDDKNKRQGTVDSTEQGIGTGLDSPEAGESLFPYVSLPDYGEILEPTYGVKDPDSGEWVLLVKEIASGLDLDLVHPDNEKGNGWKATIQAKFERLLRETQIPIGLLCNGTEIRLVYAPRGESSGYLTFPVSAMVEVSGRSILGALVMLIGADRLFNVPSDLRLGKILSSSRDYQAEVSTKLADQVLDALWELLRGFQSANALSNGLLLAHLADLERGDRAVPLPDRTQLSTDNRTQEFSNVSGVKDDMGMSSGSTLEAVYHINKEGAKHIYGGLITTLMRLVFLLYAEDEGLMPDDTVYQQNYSVSGLYERLREDMGNYPDTMDMRYGAWAWILSLFRLVYDGGGAVPEYLPARHGQLFDPHEYPFLEGRIPHYSKIPPLLRGVRGDKMGSASQTIDNLQGVKEDKILEIPRVSDGVIYRVLDKLLMLDGERLSYRALDVEQIGSVYEAIMGYEVEVAVNPSIGVKSKPKGSKFSTTIVVDLQALLSAKAGDRAKLLKDWGDCEVKGNSLKALKSAKTLEEIVGALDRKVSERTPNILPKGSLYLQPGEERRRTGSHYTPRKLTQPIVETTLQPIFAQLGKHPTPEQILSLKICDLAMGSAAFLVEACRQLADKLVESWEYHGKSSFALAGEEVGFESSIEPLLYARRLVAQRCLYGVDKNPFAVNLAKLSLWLVTLAKDLPFTFVDHALKCGDSLVGLTRGEIGSFGKDTTQDLPLMKLLKEKIDKAKSYRDEIQGKDTQSDEDAEVKFQQWQKAEVALGEARLIGNVKVAAFFSSTKQRERDERLTEYGEVVRDWRQQQLASASVDDSDFQNQGEGVGNFARSDEGGDNLTSLNRQHPIYHIANSITQTEKPIIPFNWELEFPEVFDRDNPGFDVIIGNPPFAGKNTTINGNPEGYVDWLKVVHPEAHGNSDLVAHFFRRAFTITRKHGTFGLIATNTIAQGDTRTTGLRFICNHGGIIYNARKRVKWHGLAAVVVSVVHVFKDK